jgi:peptide deformylase
MFFRGPNPTVFFCACTGPCFSVFFCGVDCRAYNLRMSILKIARMGHPVLRAKARAVHPSEIRTPRIQQLIDDMFETMKEYQGVGLAAPQVHEGLRIFVAGFPPRKDLDEDEEDNDDGEDVPLMALVNPEIEVGSREVYEDWEGCLSIPDIRGRVPRARQIVVRAFDRSGRKIELPAAGFTARVIQHETDHLDGVLFFDRMKSFNSLTFLDEYGRYWSGHNARED